MRQSWVGMTASKLVTKAAVKCTTVGVVNVFSGARCSSFEDARPDRGGDEHQADQRGRRRADEHKKIANREEALSATPA